MQVTSLGVLQIPDIDAIIHTSDFSCIKATSVGQQPAGPPIFGYNSDPAHEDVPFPDYSYWGHEYTRLRGAPSQGCIACVNAAAGNLLATFIFLPCDQPWAMSYCFSALTCVTKYQH